MNIHRTRRMVVVALASLLATPLLPLSGCEGLPGGGRTEQSTVTGGTGGAVVGAVLAKQNRLLEALIGGELGAGGGYLMGARTDWFKRDQDENRREARLAIDGAQNHPATAEDARRSTTVDLNNDGFVTLDEVLAMKSAGLSDSQMIRRLEATNQVFDLNDEQQRFLRDHGISQKVIDRMLEMNRSERDRLIGSSATGDDVISHDRRDDR